MLYSAIQVGYSEKDTILMLYAIAYRRWRMWQ